MSSEPREVCWFGVIDFGNFLKKREKIFDFYDEDPKEEIVLYLNSPGGQVEVALDFYELMKSRQVNLTVVGQEKVSSAAVLVFLAGKKRIAGKSCKFFFHNGTKRLSGNYSVADLEELKQRMIASTENVNRTIQEETDLSEPTLKELKSDKKILMGSEAKEFGIISEIKEI